MVSIEAFSELLATLYSAPLHDEQWQRFLTLLANHTQSKSAYFFCGDTRLGISAHAFGGSVPDEMDVLREYNERHAAKDPYRIAVIRKGCIRAFRDDDLLPEEDLLQHDMYHHLLVRLGHRYGVFVPLTISIRRFEVISLWRAPEQGPATDDSLCLLELLLPHLQAALELRQVLGVAQQKIAAMQTIADASATPVFLLTRKGQLVESNAAADKLLRDATALVLKQDLLETAEPKARSAFRRLLETTASSPLNSFGESPVHTLSLECSAGRKALPLIASPVPPSNASAGHADVLLLAGDSQQPSHHADAVLRSLYRLTPAEAEVAIGLQMGFNVEEIAGLRRCSPGTVRNQVKSVLSKTGTARQSDLVRLLMTLPQTPSTL